MGLPIRLKFGPIRLKSDRYARNVSLQMEIGEEQKMMKATPAGYKLGFQAGGGAGGIGPQALAAAQVTASCS